MPDSVSESVLIDKILNEPRPLSSAQREAVISDSPHTRIIAGAGAGKTETLTRRIAYLLLVKKVKPENIVAFTFTEKAAKSMKSRVYERIKALNPDLCNYLGDMFVGTIHGFCNRILETEFKHGNYNILDDKQEMAYILRQGWGLKLDSEKNYSASCNTFIRSMNVVYSELIDDHVLKAHAPKFFEQLKKYEELLESHKCLTFNLLIKKAIECLEENPKATERIQYLIVDEYQDINRAQEKLIQFLGAFGSIFVVGDPRQTIYQWRGSDDACFDDFVSHYPDTKTILIQENRRSTKDVIMVANGFADTISDKSYEHMLPTRDDNGGVYILNAHYGIDEVNWIAREIQRLVSSGQCNYRDIALLFRSVKTSAPPFIDTFRNLKIPFVIGGKVGLFRRPEIKVIGMLFCWLYEKGFWQENPYQSQLEITHEMLLTQANELWKREMQRALPIEELEAWRDDVHAGYFNNFTDVYHRLLPILGFNDLNPDNPYEAAVMANMGKFDELLTDFEAPNSLGGKKRKWSSDLKNLCWFINTFASSQYEEQSGDEQSQVDAVQIMTIHQSKGLEWAVVFIPALVARRFPSSMAGRTQKWLFPSHLLSEKTVRRYEGSEDSERKLMYVALTRAKDVVVCSHFSSTDSNRSAGASAFIPNLADISNSENITVDMHLPDRKYSLAHDSSDMETFAVTDVMTYERCPRMYLFRNVWGFQPGLSEYLGYGTMLHFCLRETANLIVEEDYPPISAARTAVDEYFHMPYLPRHSWDNMKEGAKRELARFAHECEDDMRRIREVETHIELPLQNAILSGQVDVILHEEDGGTGIEVRDYKTSDRVITKENLETQIQLYSHALSSTGENVVKGSVAYIQDARVESVNVCCDARAETLERVGKAVENIRSGKYGRCSGTACEMCDYVALCHKKV